MGSRVEAYAYARTGYHRGLDALRRAGWKGHGPVPWEHEPNQGFLRALHALGRAAAAIGERTRRALRHFADSDPAGRGGALRCRPARPVRSALHPSCWSRRGWAAAMPAIVLVGAQWGDEGKGKATDLLGSRVDVRRQVQRRQQRRAHHRHRRREVRAAPAALRHPHARLRPGHRQRRGHRPRRAVRGDRRARGARRRHLPAGRQRLRARHHVVQPHARQGHRAVPRQRARSARPGAASARRTPTRWPASASACRTCSTRTCCGQKVTGALELKNQVLVKIYNRKAVDVDAVVDELLRPTPTRLRPMVADTVAAARPGCSTTGKTVVLEAGQATLLDVDHGTYPFVTSSSATAGGACTGSGHPADAHRPGDRGGQGVHDPRRRGAVPDRAASTTRASALRNAGAEFGTTTGRPRRCGWFDAPRSPGTRRGSTASPTSCSPSSTC